MMLKSKLVFKGLRYFFREKNYCPTYKKKLEVHTISHFFGIFFFKTVHHTLVQCYYTKSYHNSRPHNHI